MKKINIEMLNPFGAPILHGSLPEDLIKSFENVCDEVLDDKRTPWNKNLVGRIEDEWKVPDLLYRDHKIDVLLDSLFRKYTETYYIQLRKIINLDKRLPDEYVYKDDFKINVHRGDGWVNSMRDGEFNPVHHHTNCDLSSIFYINDYQGDIPRIAKGNDENTNQGGQTEFIIGSYSNGAVPQNVQGKRIFTQGFQQMTHFPVKPKRGDFFIFPHWLMHAVYPFIGKKRRVSFSINYRYEIDLREDKILSTQLSELT